jgi:hypothetical protein
MQKNYILLFLLFSIYTFAQRPQINEIDYLGPTGNAIEIAGLAGTDLNGYVLEFSGGINRNVYLTINLSGIIDDEGSGIGALSFSVTSPDDIIDTANTGVALSDGTNLIQFLSWGGATFIGKGAAQGITSTNIGTASAGESLQWTDTGWVSAVQTLGSLSAGQTTLSVVKNEIAGFALYPNPVVSGKFAISTNGNTQKNAQIYALNGSLVYQNYVQSNEVIDVANLNRGIYIVKVEEEGKIATRKLIVE